MDRENKIRRYLGENYHLNVSYDEYFNYSWKLFRKYEGFLTDDSGPIMTSSTNTDNELYKFAKKHRRYDSILSWSKTNVILSMLGLIIIMLGIIFKFNYHGFFYGVELSLLISMISNRIVSNHNYKVSVLEFAEKLKESVNKYDKEENK